MSFIGEIATRVVTRFIFMGALVGGGGLYLNHGAGGDSGAAGAIGGITSILGAQSGIPAFKKPADTHYTAQARVTKVVTECRLMQTVDGKMRRTAIMPCTRASLLLEEPSFATYTLGETKRVSYIYYASDGVNVHEGSYELHGNRTAIVSTGDVIDVKIDSKNPSQSTPVNI